MANEASTCSCSGGPLSTNSTERGMNDRIKRLRRQMSGQLPGALKDSLSPFDIFPDRLTCPVFLRVCPALKNPQSPGLPLHLLIQSSGPLHSSGLAGLFLPHGLPPFKVSSAQLQDIRHPQTGRYAQLHHKPILWHQCRQYMAQLLPVRIGSTHDFTPF